MSSNVFHRLRDLLPLPALLLGTVREINSDDTSTVEIPGDLPLTGYGDGTIATGSLIRARGTGVAVGKKAFVRAGVIETQGPDGDPLDIPIGGSVSLVAPAHADSGGNELRDDDGFGLRDDGGRELRN